MCHRNRLQQPVTTGPSSNRRGTSATEFALVLPLLMLIALGCIDFGRVSHCATLLNNAAGRGAAHAATHPLTVVSAPTWEAGVRNAVIEEMESLSEFDAQSLVVTANGVTDAQGTVWATVEAVYPFKTIIDWPGLPSSLSLRYQVSVRQYR